MRRNEAGNPVFDSKDLAELQRKHGRVDVDVLRAEAQTGRVQDSAAQVPQTEARRLTLRELIRVADEVAERKAREIPKDQRPDTAPRFRSLEDLLAACRGRETG
jgi:hypothetical protein